MAICNAIVYLNLNKSLVLHDTLFTIKCRQATAIAAL
jgi:hypothetical protein